MANAISSADLGAAIVKELEIYHESTLAKINEASEAAVKDLVKLTKASAPVKTGSFKRNISSQVVKGSRGNTCVWYVKAPDHRLTHLLVHGHAKQNGGRVPGDPFLQNALNQVLPGFERAVEEAIQNGE